MSWSVRWPSKRERRERYPQSAHPITRSEVQRASHCDPIKHTGHWRETVPATFMRWTSAPVHSHAMILGSRTSARKDGRRPAQPAQAALKPATRVPFPSDTKKFKLDVGAWQRFHRNWIQAWESACCRSRVQVSHDWRHSLRWAQTGPSPLTHLPCPTKRAKLRRSRPSCSNYCVFTGAGRPAGSHDAVARYFFW